MTLAGGTWLNTLDEFERHLAIQAELIEEGRYDEVVAFQPPPALPAVPLELVDRLVQLMGRAQALTDRGGVLRDDISKRLAQTRRPAFARRHASAYVDQRA